MWAHAWVKNGKKAIFIPATSLATQFSLKKKMLRAIVFYCSSALSKLKDKVTGLHKTLYTKVYFLLKLITSSKSKKHGHLEV